ncbi:MAG: 23S rRNA (adenine(2503)-C(2))-methyltransferase RlmN [Firmicutes bacterium]|nr:23S rRNA (adenine(2503)-C(2))-methyltransferase RlmN [Bacillota bacterium]
MDKPNIYGQTLEQLQEYFRRQGENPAKARIVFRRLYREGCASFSDLTPLGTGLRQKLADDFSLERPAVLRRLEDEKAIKYLLELTDGNCVESVVMKHRYGWSLCLSCQVGCAMGCVFCASGKNGLVRDLTPAEMVGQLLCARADAARPINALAVMGMGEPFANHDNLDAFLDIVTEPAGLDMGPRHITVSTCGLPEGIRRFAARPRPHNLCVSLHAADDELRRQLMPIASRVSLESLLAAAWDYAELTRQKVVFEYAMLEGVNDGDEQALKLRELLSGRPCSVNLIPYNATDSGFRPSGKDRVLRFYDLLKQGGVSVTIRREMGASVQATCGQLRQEQIKAEGAADKSPLD